MCQHHKGGGVVCLQPGVPPRPQQPSRRKAFAAFGGPKKTIGLKGLKMTRRDGAGFCGFRSGHSMR